MFNDTDISMMAIALEEARRALCEGEIPVGAVVARGDELISRAHNAREATRDPLAHAEMRAISAAARALKRWRLNGLTLYVTLEPCPMCAGAIVMCGLSRVIYGAKDMQYGCAGSVYRLTEDPAFQSYCPADGGLEAEKCAELLKSFFKSVRKG